MQFAASENIVIPSSKAHFPVALLVDSAELDGATNSLCLRHCPRPPLWLGLKLCSYRLRPAKPRKLQINPRTHLSNSRRGYFFRRRV